MRVLALFGPTAVGKTQIAIAAAQLLRRGGEDPVAVSADALQVYRGLAILTGAPSDGERRALEHRLVGFLAVQETFSVGRYAQLAHHEIDTLLAEGRRPIVVGGTGLYLRAALADLRLRPQPPAHLREELTARLEREGAGALHRQLAEAAPWAAARIEPADGRRIVRALELAAIGELRERSGESELWSEELRHPTASFALVPDRDALREAIGSRVDEMFAQGAREEVLSAEAQGASATARAAVGYRELLSGDLEAMKRRTWAYARRQMTWLRKLPASVRRIEVSDRSAEDVAAEIVDSAAP
jgi:tRNA dimethylallyltransferase